ncbi:MDR family MFS transporter [Amycolatopsis sp. GM8]|uniref:MDR family MFS transporter n=1 Tax=Amycolatopsis sp. GM8 TaxID=2896530 RepID=UPI001F2E00D1|nr:MDR family MFS transporter [Amycolatopsis sp. GM8]
MKLDPKVLVVLPGFMLATLLSALDQTVVATSLPTIATDLGGLTHLSWVVTAYALTVGISMPIHGKLADIVDRKRQFQLCLLLFVIGSALCGLASTLGELVAFRAVQGIGAGGLVVGSQAILAELIPPAERGRYLGFMQSVYALGTVTGPLIGGLLTQGLSWRWVFYVNLPIGAVALAVVAWKLKLPKRHRPKPRIDWWGPATLSIGAASVMLVASWGGSAFGWLSPQILALTGAAVLFLVVFVAVERKASEPMLPLRLFGNRVVRVLVPLVFCLGVATLGATIFVPLFLQVVDGVSPAVSGLRLAPLWLCWAVAATASGHAVARFGRYRVFPRTGTCLLTMGLIGLASLGVAAPYWIQALALGTIGLGLGMINSVMLVVAQSAVGRDDVGVATSTTTFSQTMGASLGVAVLGAVFAGRLTDALSRTVPPAVVERFSHSGINIDRAQIDALPPDLRTEFIAGFAHALHGVFLTAAVVGLLAAVLAWVLPQIQLRQREKPRSFTGTVSTRRIPMDTGSARAGQ